MIRNAHSRHIALMIKKWVLGIILLVLEILKILSAALSLSDSYLKVFSTFQCSQRI